LQIFRTVLIWCFEIRAEDSNTDQGRQQSIQQWIYQHENHTNDKNRKIQRLIIERIPVSFSVELLLNCFIKNSALLLADIATSVRSNIYSYPVGKIAKKTV